MTEHNDQATEAADALHALYVLLCTERGLHPDAVLAGFHAQVATSMAAIFGGEQAEALMRNAGARLRQLPSLDQMQADPIGPAKGSA